MRELSLRTQRLSPRRQWLVGVAIGVLLGLTGSQVVGLVPFGQGSQDDLMVLPMLGTGPMPLVDGDDIRARFEVAMQTAAADELRTTAGIDAVHAAGPGRYEVVTDTLTLQDVAGLPGVSEAGEAALVRPTLNDTFLHHQWGLENIGATFGEVRGIAGVDVGLDESSRIATGAGVVVAVIDSGIQTNHPDLAGHFWQNADETCGNGLDDDGNGFVDDCNGWDFVHGDDTVFDVGSDNDHGTHIAGIISAATDNGTGVASLAPGARIMSLKVFDGGSAPATRVAAAMHYAIDNGADVINLSLGGPHPSPAQEVALDRARDAGILVVVAAGNSGQDLEWAPSYPASHDHENLLVVGSHSANGDVSPFSNFGASSVDVYAPGDMVASTLPGNNYGYMSGTSMAAPMVAAAAALVAEVEGTTDSGTLKELLTANAVPASVYEHRSTSGGRVFAPLALGDPIAVSGELRADFAGLDGLEPGPVDASITATLAAAVENEAELELFFVRWHEGALHAVLDHEIQVEVGKEAHALVTDSEGRLGMPALADDARAALEAGTLELGLHTTLPEGRYAVVLAAFVTNGKILDPSAAFFEVGEPADEAPPVLPVPPTPRPKPVPAPTSPGVPVPQPSPVPEPTVDPELPGEEPVILPSPAPTSPAPGQPTTGDPDPGPAPAPSTAPSPKPAPAPKPTPAPGPQPAPVPTQPTPEPTSPAPKPTPVPTAPTPQPSTSPKPVPAPLPPQPAPSDPAPAPLPSSPPPPPTDGGDRASVWPNTGPTTGGTLVNIRGQFDPTQSHLVRIGEQVHTPVLVSTWIMTVVTRPAKAAGPLDVVVLASGNEVVEHLDAFEYLDDDTIDRPDSGDSPDTGDSADDTSDSGDSGDSADDTSDSGDSGDSDGSADEDTGDSEDSDDTDGQPTVPAPGDGPVDPSPGQPAPTDPSPVPIDDDRPFPAPIMQKNTAGQPRTLADGMRIDEIVRGPLISISVTWWDARGCVTVTCPGFPIRR